MKTAFCLVGATKSVFFGLLYTFTQNKKNHHQSFFLSRREAPARGKIIKRQKKRRSEAKKYDFEHKRFLSFRDAF